MEQDKEYKRIQDQKYLVIESNGAELMFTFPADVAHDHMLAAIKGLKEGIFGNTIQPHTNATLVSAGKINSNNECYDKAFTLKINSRPEDTEILRNGQYKILQR